jgi:formylglycine-generating enzyme required for sulfatase activity
MEIKLGHSFVLPSIAPSKIYNSDQPLIWVEPGSFLMGPRVNEIGYYEFEDNLPFEMTLSKGFWLGKYPMTQAFWNAFSKINPSHFQDENTYRPVENVSWDEAINFCNLLNKYFSEIIPLGYKFRLPTEAQWEYSCRAGTETMYYSGNTKEDLIKVAWFFDNSKQQTHEVGKKAANHLGFYDMHGNVCEWCFDQPEDYPNNSVTDWVGRNNLNFHSYRGGSWNDKHEEGGLRSAASAYGISTLKKSTIGFRLCLSCIDE